MGNYRAKKEGMFSYYRNVDELMSLYVGYFRHINDLCMFFL
jgi:hypothetical protein